MRWTWLIRDDRLAIVHRSHASLSLSLGRRVSFECFGTGVLAGCPSVNCHLLGNDNPVIDHCHWRLLFLPCRRPVLSDPKKARRLSCVKIGPPSSFDKLQDVCLFRFPTRTRQRDTGLEGSYDGPFLISMLTCHSPAGSSASRFSEGSSTFQSTLRVLSTINHSRRQVYT